MNEEIRTLEKVIEQLRRRVTIAARDPFVLNSYSVQIGVQPGNKFIEVYVDGDYVGGMSAGGSYDDARSLAGVIARVCNADREHYAATMDELMYRLDRAED